MDSQTYIQKVTDSIYQGCDKRRKWKLINDSVTEVVESADEQRVPYYYLSVLQVIDDLHLNDFYSDELDEKLKKMSRELTLHIISSIVIELFESHFDEEENEKLVEDIVATFRRKFEEEFSYQDLVMMNSTEIVNKVRTFSSNFINSIDLDYNFAHFDKELTEHLYDTIDCEEDADEDVL